MKLGNATAFFRFGVGTKTLGRGVLQLQKMHESWDLPRNNCRSEAIQSE